MKLSIVSAIVLVLLVGGMLLTASGSRPPASYAQVTTIRVAVESSGTASGADLAAQLNNDTFFDFAATVVTASQIDSVAELDDYDVVVIGDSGVPDNDMTDAMATALRDWAQSTGGGVVSVGWIDFAVGNDGSTAARDAILDEVMPIDGYPNTSNNFCGGPPSTVQILVSNHPVTEGLSDFVLTTSADIEVSPNPPDATNGQILGTATSGSCSSSGALNAIVVGNLGDANLVYLGPVYLAQSSYNVGDLRSGSPDRLLEQAVAWAAEGALPEPTPTAEPSTTPRPRPTATRPPNIGGALSGLFTGQPTPLPQAAQPAARAGGAPASTSPVAITPPRTGEAGLAGQPSPFSAALIGLAGGAIALGMVVGVHWSLFRR
jgi:hypothetical protein